LGVVETISVQIQSGDGTVSRATKKIIPSRVDLIVTANTLTPPFYKGRRLGSAGSDMTATAQVFLGSPKETGALTYVWSVADRVQNGGIASVNNAITFSSGFEDELLVAVTVYKNGVAVAGKSVFVTIAKSEIHFYEKNLLRGLSMVAMKTPHLFIGEELLLRAEPYFVDRDLISNSIKPAWKINNRTMDGNQDNPYELSLQKQGSAGSAQISFSLQNVAKLLQSVQGSIGVQF
jgi:hypothetical protein